MGEPYLTMAEIENRYPNEWVLIDRPTEDRRTGRVSGGHVVMHSPDRAEVDRWLLALRPGELPVFAYFYIGRPPADDEFIGEEPAVTQSR